MVISILILLSSMLSFSLAIFVWRNNPRKVVNKTFAYFASIMTLWILVNFIFRLTQDLLLLKTTYLFGPLLPLSFLIWFNYFFRGEVRGKVRKLLIVILALIGLVISGLIYLSQLVVTDNLIAINEVEVGPLFPVYSVYMFLLISVLIFEMYSIYKQSYGLKKQQIKYILFGIILFSFTALIVSFLLPMLGYIAFSDLDSPSSLFFLVLTAYAIIKHRLMDVRLIILRTITYSLVVLLISATVVIVTLFLPEALAINTTTKAIIAVAASIFIVLILDPLKKVIGKATDNLFFKAKVDYQNILTELGEVINREIDLDILLYSLSQKLEKKLKIKNVSKY